MNQPLDSDKLTWAVLLGRWVEFARSAVALPRDEAGQRLRDSVVDIITLQAVWFALQHLEELDPDERALGIDRAQVLIEKHAGALRDRFAPDAPPPQITELIDDALHELHRRREA